MNQRSSSRTKSNAALLLALIWLAGTATAAHAQPQTWPAEAQLKPTVVGRECLDYPMMYEVSVDADTIAINTPQQKTHRVSIATGTAST
jgi:hypothetical protein